MGAKNRLFECPATPVVEYSTAKYWVSDGEPKDFGALDASGILTGVLLAALEYVIVRKLNMLSSAHLSRDAEHSR